MIRFRQAGRPDVLPPAGERELLLIEDSAAMATLLKQRIEARVPTRVDWVRSYADAAQRIATGSYALAVTGLNLPDAPRGEIVDLLARCRMPTIVFTAHLDERVRDRITGDHLIDYFLKDGPDSVRQVADAIERLSGNHAHRILVVDDARSTRTMLCRLLGSQNYQVLEAASGDEALAPLADERVDLVITDYNMPNMNGDVLVRRIREIVPADRLRIIGISSSSNPMLSAALLKAGAEDFIYRPFNPEEVRCRVRNHLDTLRRIAKLRFLAERDPLSGLYNRRAFFERAAARLDAMHAAGGEGAIAILDIDHFKSINDRFGHDVGDIAIRAVSGVLSAVGERHPATVARVGGEEFVMLMTGIDRDAALSLCEEVRLRVQALEIDVPGGPLHFTTSIGMSAIGPGAGIDQHLQAADRQLYRAKSGGRNRVESAPLAA